MANYGAAKTGLIGLTRVLAAEGAGTDIKVDAVAPIAATRMLDHSMNDFGDPAQRAVIDEVMRPFLERLDPVGAGHVAQFFVGRTAGYHHPQLPYYTVPSGPGDEMAELYRALMAPDE
jgi:NAD(P)-dependent dehydrogenase (short-subunit alcohol dehydrogenase family)